MIDPNALPRLRKALRDHYLADERPCLLRLAAEAALPTAQNAAALATARALVAGVRERMAAHRGMQSFMHQYDLSSQEGVLLMCVAEALLRIPDASTADRLIRDKFAQGEWERHLGQSQSLLVNAGTWGMLLTGRLVTLAPDSLPSVGGWLASLAQRSGEPIVRAALRQGMKLMAGEFVMGRTIEDALARAADPEHRTWRYSYDMLGEAALTAQDAERYRVAYARAIEAIGGAVRGGDVFAAPSISVKLSALHPRYEHALRARVLAELVPVVRALALSARERGIGFCIDAEEADRLDLSLDVVEAVFRTPELAGWDGFGLAVQAYQKRAPFVIDWLAALIRSVGASEGAARRMMVRLVKGAYWDTEIKRAQVGGHAGYPVFTRKAATDVSYLACAARMLAAPDAFYSMFATHNAHTAAAILQRARQHGLTRDHFELQRLHGMGEELHAELVRAHGMASRVYAPVGSHEDLLPYLVRRLLENGANTSFVNRIADGRVPVAEVVVDPLQQLALIDHQPNARIPMPEQLYGSLRRNARGFSFADHHAAEPMLAALQPWLGRADWRAAPLVAGSTRAGTPVTVVDPARGTAIGRVEEADGDAVDAAYAAARRYLPPPASARAAVLERFADLLEANAAELMALAVREAGKTLPDALGEVREAVDFARYYAGECLRLFGTDTPLPGPTGESNTLRLTPRGAFVCISPWNFPLAIFVGQVTAAFAAGNSVLAKPAEQTALIAARATQLLLQAGVPAEGLHLLPGRGETVGAALVRHADCAGVAFTGSTEVARLINRTLAQKDGPIVPLIAETGGLNAMIVDSSALPEQVVNDAIASAFNSAGQRCSALRVLFVQQDVAPRVLDLLEGALAQLTVGDPADLATDVGPVIDRDAQAQLERHVRTIEARFPLRCKADLPALEGTFFAPRVYEIDSISTLEREVFGPILHVVRYAASDLPKVIEAINATGYGLTLGVHSRLESNISLIVSRARVGNVYVNRNQIGAVVGVQPFGGEGLSGTGPKAGGPHYLLRFAGERTLTVNTAAAGGNAQLIAQGE
jgi:RHH-type proline utilization regulon transcriptional repressor/proline dehydrogenase/delta 1-pyrroline-5-carboxylate dehydrogenase